MAQTVAVQHRANNRLCWANKFMKATPLWSSRRLGSLCFQLGFDKWDTIGISTLGDLVHRGKLLTFSDLQQKYALAQGEVFLYLQIKHAIHTKIPDLSSLPDASPLEDRLLSEPLQTKAISCTYRELCNNLPDSFQTLRD